MNQEGFVEPTVLVNPKLESLAMIDEIFGPVLPIITYESFDEVLE